MHGSEGEVGVAMPLSTLTNHNLPLSHISRYHRRRQNCLGGWKRAEWLI